MKVSKVSIFMLFFGFALSNAMETQFRGTDIKELSTYSDEMLKQAILPDKYDQMDLDQKMLAVDHSIQEINQKMHSRAHTQQDMQILRYTLPVYRRMYMLAREELQSLLKKQNERFRAMQ